MAWKAKVKLRNGPGGGEGLVKKLVGAEPRVWMLDGVRGSFTIFVHLGPNPLSLIETWFVSLPSLSFLSPLKFYIVSSPSSSSSYLSLIFLPLFRISELKVFGWEFMWLAWRFVNDFRWTLNRWIVFFKSFCSCKVLVLYTVASFLIFFLIFFILRVFFWFCYWSFRSSFRSFLSSLFLYSLYLSLIFLTFTSCFWFQSRNRAVDLTIHNFWWILNQ